ncbi:MAG: zinc ribbon domain-containing protein [Candidatus Omnitrophota bacterium]|nr:zinc ribbon domain-containing protein [Candidatus Omnitrophota bacterium]
MPTYEYKCSHCNHEFELFQKITDKHIESCPKCNKKVKRLIGSGAGIIFKGTGFYATDYKKRSKPDTEKSCSSTCPKAKECSMKP